MARETKAERAEREAVDRDNEWNLFRDSYPTRFSALMFSYFDNAHAGFQVKRLDAETYSFSCSNHFDSFDLKVTPPANFNYETMFAMEQAESALEDYAKEVAEANRRYQVKTAALAKLSKEEKELLGL
jgi:hypothetical protein